MPRGTFEDNQTLTSKAEITPFDYLKVEPKGAYARLRVFEGEGQWWWEWCHTISAPIIGGNGFPIVTEKFRKDKTPYNAFEDEFVAARICLGRPEVIAERGLDEERCPMCAAAARGLDKAAPQRRFAFLVFRYATTASGDLTKPASGKLYLWRLNQNGFNDLQAARRDIRDLLGDQAGEKVLLSDADIMIQCVSTDYGGRNEIRAPKRSAYTGTEDFRAFIDAVLEHEPNLRILQAEVARSGVVSKGYTQ